MSPKLEGSLSNMRNVSNPPSTVYSKSGMTSSKMEEATQRPKGKIATQHPENNVSRAWYPASGPFCFSDLSFPLNDRSPRLLLKHIIS